VRFSAHRWLTVPLLRRLYAGDAEDAHHAGIKGLRALGVLGLSPRERGGGEREDGDLAVEVGFSYLSSGLW
jgi:dihydroorotate dehydrogenase